MPGLDDEFLTVAEIAELLKLNQQTIRNWIDQGRLPALHVGRRVRVRRSDLEALLERGYTGRRGPDPDPGPIGALWDGEIAPPEAP